MNGNTFISWVLRSPFHSLLSNGMLLMTVIGRRTGRRITFPVGYYRAGNCLWVLTTRDRTWWRNLEDGAEVELLMKRKPVTAFAELEMGEDATARRMEEYIRHVPQAARPMRIRMEEGKPNREDISRIAKDRLFVRIETK